MKALIVDDEEDIGMMVSRFLTNEGLEVTYANSVDKARRMIQQHSFQIFFLDLNLPDGTGFDLIPDIRKSEKVTKIIVISAHDGEIETARAEEMGVDLFIPKPFTKRQVVDAVADLV